MRRKCCSALVLAHRRRLGRLAPSESKTAPLDFRVPGDGCSLLGKRGALRQSAQLCDGAALSAYGSIRHSVRLLSRADEAAHFSNHQFRRLCSCLFGRDTAWQVSVKS
jgi:hypothetical protein